MGWTGPITWSSWRHRRALGFICIYQSPGVTYEKFNFTFSWPASMSPAKSAALCLFLVIPCAGRAADLTNQLSVNTKQQIAALLQEKVNELPRSGR